MRRKRHNTKAVEEEVKKEVKRETKRLLEDMLNDDELSRIAPHKLHSFKNRFKQHVERGINLSYI